MTATPLYTPAEARARETFLALMWALSYPGRVYDLPGGNPLTLIGEALLDLETSFFTPDRDLSHVLMQTGARLLPAEAAAYHFYPVLDDRALESIERASVGTMQFPDQAATILVRAVLESGAPLRLRGPGIQDENLITLGDVPAHFWTLRQRAMRYPLGWDVYVIDGSRVVGLPRSTTIEVLED